MQWHLRGLGEKVLRAALEDKPLPQDVRSLHPAQLEVLCLEYLRVKGWLAGLLLPIGRTLRDVDIVGVDDQGRTVLAQVTGDEVKAPDKLRRLKDQLKPHAEGAKPYFFAPMQRKSELEQDMVEYVPIEAMFDEMRQHSTGSRIIRRMLGES
jgi:hypothetical protein